MRIGPLFRMRGRRENIFGLWNDDGIFENFENVKNFSKSRARPARAGRPPSKIWKFSIFAAAISKPKNVSAAGGLGPKVVQSA